jgi:hypothetical protein
MSNLRSQIPNLKFRNLNFFILLLLVEAFQQRVGPRIFRIATQQFRQDLLGLRRLPGLDQGIGQGESLLRVVGIEINGRFQRAY